MIEAKPFVISKWQVMRAFELVKANAGAAGIDSVSIADFEANLDEEQSLLQQELCNWTY